MAAKSGGKAIFAKKSPVDSAYILWDKNFIKITLSRTVSEISVFKGFSTFSQDKCIFAFYAEIQDGSQKWRKNDFCKKSPVHSGHPGGRKFRRNLSISHG